MTARFPSLPRPARHVAGPFARAVPRRVATGFALALAGTALAVVALSVLLAPDTAPAQAAMALALLALLAAVLWGGLRQHYPHRLFGLCNGVTLLRAGMTCVLAALLWRPDAAGDWAVVGLAGAALALDGVDGRLARRSGLSSAFGARFDMEVDAALGLILAGHALLAGTTGAVWPALLLLGGMRYLFIAASRLWPWLAAPLPESFRRKLVCVVQIAVLIALSVPLLPGAVAAPLAVAGAAALAWSFAVDVAWLARNRGGTT